MTFRRKGDTLRSLRLSISLSVIPSVKQTLLVIALLYYDPANEEWWRGIKCYPCPCVRSCVRP